MAITDTNTNITGDETEAFESFVADTLAQFDGALVSQSRAVDVLLDCWNATTSRSARDLVGGYLAEIQFLSAVTTDELRDMAAMICMAAEVDSAFDHFELDF